jgi:small redox-active disulfide protein 2
MKQILVLGTGCPKCRKLYEAACDAVKQSGADAEVKKVEDLNEILKHGAMMTPGLVVDGTVVASGKVLSAEEIKKLLV